MGRPYTVIDSRSVTTLGTLIQLTAASSEVLEITRAWVTNTSSTTSAQNDVVLIRKTATVTGGTAITPAKLRPGDVAAVSTAVRNATGEGTEGDIVAGEGNNVLNGWLWIPTEVERIWVPPSGMIALKFQATPASATYRYGISYLSHG